MAIFAFFNFELTRLLLFLADSLSLGLFFLQFVLKPLEVGFGVLVDFRQSHELLFYFVVVLVHGVQPDQYFIHYDLCTEGSARISSFD